MRVGMQLAGLAPEEPVSVDPVAARPARKVELAVVPATAAPSGAEREEVPSLDAGELLIEAAAAGPTVIRLSWRGRSIARRAPALLRPYFDQVLPRALERHLSLELNFET